MHKVHKASCNMKLEMYYLNSAVRNATINIKPDSSQEMDVKFSFFSEDFKPKFNLSIYIDYKQVNFKVNDVEYRVYPINIKDISNTFDIPVVLDKRYFSESHKMLVSICDTNFSSKSMYFNSIEEVYYLNEKNSETKNLQYRIPTKTYIDTGDTALFSINQDFTESIKDYTKKNSKGMDKSIICSPNEKIPLAIRFLNYVGNGTELITLNMNNSQVKIQSSDYLLYNLTNKVNIIYDKIYITAPDKKGEYRLNGFLISNPMGDSNIVIYEPLAIHISVK